MPKTTIGKTVTLPIELIEELKALEKKLGLSLNFSEEITKGFRLRIDQIKAKFSFKG